MRRKIYSLEFRNSAAFWERKGMLRGAIAAVAFAAIFLILWFASVHPFMAFAVVAILAGLTALAVAIFMVSRDIDFNGDLRE